MTGIIEPLTVGGNQILHLIDRFHMVGKSQKLATLLCIVTFAYLAGYRLILIGHGHLRKRLLPDAVGCSHQFLVADNTAMGQPNEYGCYKRQTGGNALMESSHILEHKKDVEG